MRHESDIYEEEGAPVAPLPAWYPLDGTGEQTWPFSHTEFVQNIWLNVFQWGFNPITIEEANFQMQFTIPPASASAWTGGIVQPQTYYVNTIPQPGSPCANEVNAMRSAFKIFLNVVLGYVIVVACLNHLSTG
jgi:hypothetical protein